MKQLLTAGVFILSAACRSGIPNPDREKEIILKNWVDWGKKADAGDPGFYWADDMVIMGPGAPMLKGKKEFLRMFSGLKHDQKLQMDWGNPSEIIVSKDGQMAYLFAKNVVTFSDSAGHSQTGTNQALQVWKKDAEGNWKAAVSVMYPEEK